MDNNPSADDRIMNANYDSVMRTPQGRAVLLDILEQCHLLAPSFNEATGACQAIGNTIISRASTSSEAHAVTLVAELTRRTFCDDRRGNEQ